LSEAIFLDTGPLGILTKSPKRPEIVACQEWLEDCRNAGRSVYLPEIADYELRRELIQASLPGSILRLDVLKANLIYLPITTEAMLLAADLWAGVRREGKTTADPHALDGDVILAAQMLTCGLEEDAMIVATVNPKHLARFVRCAEWQNLQP
jgi:predicted nucleic acid-binding protein